MCFFKSQNRIRIFGKDLKDFNKCLSVLSHEICSPTFLPSLNTPTFQACLPYTQTKKFANLILSLVSHVFFSLPDILSLAKWCLSVTLTVLSFIHLPFLCIAHFSKNPHSNKHHSYWVMDVRFHLLDVIIITSALRTGLASFIFSPASISTQNKVRLITGKSINTYQWWFSIRFKCSSHWPPL